MTYGQSAIVLLSSGVGAIPGAMFWGWMADKIPAAARFSSTSILNFPLATGVLALTLDTGGWIFLTPVFRFFVGFGVAGLYAGSTCRWCRNSCRRPSAARSAGW